MPVGQVVVHRSHGTATVTRIEQRDVGGEARDYLVLEMVVGGMTVLVPRGGMADAGVRAPMTAGEAADALEALAEPVSVGPAGRNRWARELKDNSERARGGLPGDLVHVVRAVASRGEPSAAERRLGDRARALLGAEVAVALGLTVEQADDAVAGALARATAGHAGAGAVAG